MIVEIRNIRFKLTFSFVALIVLMMIFCDEDIVIMSVFSSLIHESGHLFFMFVTGALPKKVELSLFGMRIDRAFSSALSYKKEILIALGGIIFNLIFALAAAACYYFCENDKALRLIIVNLLVAMINSLPINVLDMGRALNIFLLMLFGESRSEGISKKISNTCVILVSLFTLWYSLNCKINISLIAVTVYLYAVTIIKKWS